MGKKQIKSRFDDLIYLDNVFNAEDSAIFDMLYMGDSVLERISNYDKNRQSLKQLVKEALEPEISLCAISRSAYNPEMYYYLALALTKMRHQPRALVISINIRSFSPQWDKNPDWQFSAEVTALKSYVLFPREEIPGLVSNKKTALYKILYEWSCVRCSKTKLKRVRDFKRVIGHKNNDPEWMDYRLQQIFIYHYLPKLSSLHRKVCYLIKLAKLCHEKRIRLFFYVTPINYQLATRLIGDDFLTLYKRNVDMLSTAILKQNLGSAIKFVDYSTQLSPEYFFHPSDPTEHLNEAGRNKLAGKLSSAIRGFLSGGGNE